MVQPKEPHFPDQVTPVCIRYQLRHILLQQPILLKTYEALVVRQSLIDG